MKEFFKKMFGAQEPPAPVVNASPEPARTETKPRQPKRTKTAKEIATEKDEPYISIVRVELDPDNVGSGSFELDWNDRFLAKLVRAGYQFKANEPENVIVDRWFQEICRNVIMEHYEQEQADPDLRRVSKRNLGDGRTEIS